MNAIIPMRRMVNIYQHCLHLLKGGGDVVVGAEEDAAVS